MSNSTVNKQLSKIEKEISAVEGKKNKLVDMRLEDSIDKDTYETKYATLMEKQNTLLPTARNCRKQPRTRKILSDV